MGDVEPELRRERELQLAAIGIAPRREAKALSERKPGPRPGTGNPGGSQSEGGARPKRSGMIG